MNRGDVYDAWLDPIEGSEQGGTRPVVIVSRGALNRARPTVIVVPCTSHRVGWRLYPSHARLSAPDGGLSRDSIALCEQIRTLSKSRLGRQRGTLSAQAMAEIDRAIEDTLDLS